MKKNYLIVGVVVIAGLFPLNSLTSMQSAGQICTKNTTNENLDNQWEPVVGHFTIKVLASHKININIDDNNFEIFNWTGQDHNVRITYTIINSYDVDRVIWVGYRIFEWWNIPIPRWIPPWPGIISTPNDTRRLNPHRLHISPYNNSSGEFIIWVHFSDLPPYCDMTEFLWSFVQPPSGVKLSWDYSSQKVHFPGINYYQHILANKHKGGG